MVSKVFNNIFRTNNKTPKKKIKIKEIKEEQEKVAKNLDALLFRINNKTVKVKED